MNPANRARRWLLAPALAFLVALLTVTIAQGDQPGPAAGWPPPQSLVAADYGAQIGERDAWLDLTAEDPTAWWDATVASSQPAPHCSDIRFNDVSATEVSLAHTDADLIAESDGSRLCIFFDARWDTYSAWMLSPRSIEEFRETKAQLQPLLSSIGIDACRIAFWNSLDRQVRRQVTLDDRHDAGRECAPEVTTHGPHSGARRGEVESGFSASVAKAEEIFGWRLSWPLRIHAYDTQNDFVAGVRREGGDTSSPANVLASVNGTTTILASGHFGFLLNLSRMPAVQDLHRLVAHEFAHVAQSGALGDADSLPFFVIEGGADYFASLLVGTDHPILVGRFRSAIADERTGHTFPLRELVDVPDDDDPRYDAAYTRGYASMRFLTARWGAESFIRLHRENVGGNHQRFLEAMARLTNMSLDAFDGELRSYLLSEGAKPATVGRATYAANARIVEILTARAASGNRLEPAEQFTRSDTSVQLLFLWECLSQPVRFQIRMIAPDGQRFASQDGTTRTGCEVGNRSEFPLDMRFGSTSARSLPGTWRAEVYMDDLLQASITFVVE